jgi:hypothetical protein
MKNLDATFEQLAVQGLPPGERDDFWMPYI